MASYACGSACKLVPKRFLTNNAVAKDAVLIQPWRFNTWEVFGFAFSFCGCASQTRAKIISTSSSCFLKRNSRRADFYFTARMQYKQLTIQSRIEKSISYSQVVPYCFPSKNISEDDVSCFSYRTYESRDVSSFYTHKLLAKNNGDLLKTVTMGSSRPSNQKNCLLSKSQCQLLRVRQFSSRQGDDKNETEDDQKHRLRGAVMFVSGPFTWISKLLNSFKLKRKYDPSFSEKEFLFGASQAISYVTQMVSQGKFEHLKEVAVDEVIERLQSYRTSLSNLECKALAIEVDDFVMVKIRYIQLVNEAGKAQAAVDTMCIALRLCDGVPFLLDMGIRFARDYSTDPPSSWVINGMTHINLQNLTQR